MSLSRLQQMTPEASALLALAMWPDPARIAAALERYADNPERQVWTWTDNDRVLCAAGVEVQAGRAELLHIGTAPRARGQGAGRSLLLALMVELQLQELRAETDDGAVGFYRRCGFAVSGAAPRGGAVRYHCTLSPP